MIFAPNVKKLKKVVRLELLPFFNLKRMVGE